MSSEAAPQPQFGAQTRTQIVGTAYLTTLQGLCKIVEIVASLIAVLLVSIGFVGSFVSFFQSAAVISMIIAVFFFIMYVTAIVAKTSLSWNRIQFFINVVFPIYYLIAVAFAIHYGTVFSRLLIGGIFGLVALITHFVDGIDNYRKDPFCR